MAKDTHVARLALFALRLLVIAPIVLALWWLCMPAYAWVVGQVAALFLKIAAGYPIEHVIVEPKGLLNSQTSLGFDLGSRKPTAPISMILSNMATFIALVLSTRRLNWRERLRGLLIGCCILAVTHVAYIIVFFMFAKHIASNPQLPTAIAQVLITLPFLLWIVLAYWKSFAGDLAETNTDPSAEQVIPVSPPPS